VNKTETIRRRGAQGVALLALCSGLTFAAEPGRKTSAAIMRASFHPAPSSVSQFETPGRTALTLKPADRVLAAQMALARLGLSPGSIDGVMGPKTSAALKAFQCREGLPATGQLDPETLAQLVTAEPATCEYTLTPEDFSRLRAVEKTWLGKSMQDRLDYETILEMVAERHRSSPNLIMRLNAGIDWTNLVAGISLKVPKITPPSLNTKAAFVRIWLSERFLQAFDSDTNLLVHFPCSVARRLEKRPAGELRVVAVAANPTYTFDPEIFPESPEAREIGRKLVLPPGPNNPVGTVWIGLDAPGYGIHGTPRPEDVGRAETHGCFRLANWNAELLVQLVSIGTPVYIEP
jgi:lipoprotein-anchoring transpeptidase ErfK/SrfK